MVQDILHEIEFGKREMTDSSKDVLIAAKNKRIEALEKENKRLKAELVILRGKIYDRV
jgi:vacuolar-type H+-ATPase subunit I/STV1